MTMLICNTGFYSTGRVLLEIKLVKSQLSQSLYATIILEMQLIT